MMKLSVLPCVSVPELYPCGIKNFTRRKSCMDPGINAEIFDYLCKRAGISYEIRSDLSKEYCNAFGPHRNNTWALPSVLGAIYHGVVDTTIKSAIISSKRAADFAYTNPITFRELEDASALVPMYATADPHPILKMRKIVDNFTPQLWLLLFGLTSLFVLCEMAVRWRFKASLFAHTATSTGGTAVKALGLLLGLSALLFSSLYQNTLLTQLLIPSHIYVVKSASDLPAAIESHLTPIFSRPGTNIEDQINENPKLRQLKEAILTNGNKMYLSDDMKTAEMVNDNKAVSFCPAILGRYLELRYCNVRVIRIGGFGFGPRISAFIFRKNFSLYSRLNEAVTRNYDVIHRITERYLTNRRVQCHDFHATHVHPITMWSTTGCFLLLAVGLAASAVLFLVCEHGRKKRSQPKIWPIRRSD